MPTTLPSRPPLRILAAVLPVLLLPVLLITGCDRFRPPVPAAAPSPAPPAAPAAAAASTATASPVGYTVQTLDQTDGDCASPEGCVTVNLQVPEIVKAPSAAARAALQRFIREEWLGPSFGIKSAGDLAAHAREIFAQRRSFLADSPGQTAKWWVRRGIDVVYEDDRVVSLRYGGDSYTGGETPINEVLLASFDPATGRRLTLADLFVPGSDEALRTLAAARYRQLRRAFPGAPLKIEGHFAVVEAGLLIHFNPFELPGEAGTEPAQIVLTRAELAEVLKKDGPLARPGRPRAFFPSPLGPSRTSGDPDAEPSEPLGSDLGASFGEERNWQSSSVPH